MGDSRFDEQDSTHSMFGSQKPEQARATQRSREVAFWVLLVAIVIAAIVAMVQWG